MRKSDLHKNVRACYDVLKMALEGDMALTRGHCTRYMISKRVDGLLKVLEYAKGIEGVDLKNVERILIREYAAI